MICWASTINQQAMRIKESPERYLFLPANPTPNGRLHLGHMAGPYLRLDLYARFLKVMGHDVHVLFGTDAYDSYVSFMARKEGVPADVLATRNYELIKSDLEALAIGFDHFVDPVSPAWQEAFTNTHRALMDQLDKAGLLLL